MNLSGSSPVQRTSSVSSLNPCGRHTCVCLTYGTLAGLFLVVNGWFLVVNLGTTFWILAEDMR